mmetsp:Transcript_137545/g.348570  ORF Transcript_137545/g.348570 Transcript_137545/m.348570 type:complete len:207 (+) Transcript_137545:478-1098(+)
MPINPLARSSAGSLVSPAASATASASAARCRRRRCSTGRTSTARSRYKGNCPSMPSSSTPWRFAISACMKGTLVASMGPRNTKLDLSPGSFRSLRPDTGSNKLSPSCRNSYRSLTARKPFGSTETPLPTKCVPPSRNSPSTRSVPKHPTRPVNCSSVISGDGSTVYSISALVPETRPSAEASAAATQASQSREQRARQPSPSQVPT